jgi:hypothetical protein
VKTLQQGNLIPQQQPNLIPLSGVGSNKLLRSLKIIERCGHTTSSQQQLQGKDLEREREKKNLITRLLLVKTNLINYYTTYPQQDT